MQGETGSSKTSSSMGETLSHVADQAREQGASLASQAGAQMRGLLGNQLSSGADVIGEIARAAKTLAGQLEHTTPKVASMMTMAADTAEGFSHDMRDKSVDELMELTSDLARKQPALFVGAAVAAGFVLSRFIKASASGRSLSASFTGSRSSSSSQGMPSTHRSSPGYPSRSTSASQFHDA